MNDNQLSEKIIGAAIEVHRSLGPGLLESAYQECLFFELKSKGIKVEKEIALPITYKEVKLDHGYRIDLPVENQLVIELKTVENFTDVHFCSNLNVHETRELSFGFIDQLSYKTIKKRN